MGLLVRTNNKDVKPRDWLPLGVKIGLMMRKPDTPFPKHWLYYIVLKYMIIVAAVLIALYVAFELL
jgi:hypothetical protein